MPLAFVILCAVVFLGSLASSFLLPLLPLFADYLLDQDSSLDTLSRWSSLLVAVAPLLAGITLPVWRQVAKRRSGKELLMGLLVLSGVLLAALSNALSIREAVALRVGLGCLGLVPVLAMAMMASLPGPGTIRGRISWLRGTVGLALVLGAPLGGLLNKAIGMRMTFVVAGLISVLAALLLAVGFHKPLRDPDPAEEEPMPETTGGAWVGAVFVLTAGTAATAALLPLYLLEGLAVEATWVSTWAGVALGAMGLAGLIGQFSAALIADLLPLRTSVITGVLIACGLAWMMGQATHVVDLMAWGVAWSYVMHAITSLLVSRAVLAAGARRPTAALGRLWAVEPLGLAAGPLIAGFGAPGQPEMIFMASVLLALTAIPLVLPPDNA